MSDIVEWLREMQDEYAPGGGGVQYHENYKAAADRIEILEAREGFDWRAAYHKEHDDLCKVESRNYVLEEGVTQLTQSCIRLRAALREIIDLPKTTHAIPGLDDHFIAGLMGAAAIASKALGEE